MITLTIPQQDARTLCARDDGGELVRAEFSDGQAEVEEYVALVLCAAYEDVQEEGAFVAVEDDDIEDTEYLEQPSEEEEGV